MGERSAGVGVSILYKFQFLAHYRFMLFRLLEKFADFAEELFFGGKLDNYFVKSLHRICHSGLNIFNKKCKLGRPVSHTEG